MALTVEDGTGLADADAFITVSFADSYHTARGNSTWTDESDDSLKEAAIVRASMWLSETFIWKGYPVQQRDQSLSWPRSYVIDEEGYSIDNDVVPVEIQKATAELARQELVSPNSLKPVYTAQDRKRSVQVGPIRVEYDLSRTSAESARPVLLAVDNLIRGLTKPGTTSRLQARTTRV